MHSIVLGAGRTPSRVLLCGEAPGREEASRGLPFVGESGREQDRYLARHNLHAQHWYRTNVVKTYIEGNPDPTPELIAEWSPFLEAEVLACAPSLIIAVGRFAARWFLGDDCDMADVHGIPHRPGAFDPALARRAGPALCVLPIYHPALGLHEPSARGVIAEDYAAVADVLRRINRGDEIAFHEDPYAGREDYRDVTGAELASLIYAAMPEEIALDTEGEPGDEWSVQVSWTEGAGYVLRCEQPDFADGIAALNVLVAAGTTFILHNASTPDYAMYDVIMCRGMGLELRYARLVDTMYALYLRHESQGLKSAAYRHAAMRMTDYMSLVGEIGREKAIAYLHYIQTDTLAVPRYGKRGQRIKDGKRKVSVVVDPNTGELLPLPDLEPRLVEAGDGTWSVKTPGQLGARAEKILADIAADKRDKQGRRVDPYKRWKNIEAWLREPAELVLGPMPRGHLRDVPLSESTFYGARDADATLRLAHDLNIITGNRR